MKNIILALIALNLIACNKSDSNGPAGSSKNGTLFVKSAGNVTNKNSFIGLWDSDVVYDKNMRFQFRTSISIDTITAAVACIFPDNSALYAQVSAHGQIYSNGDFGVLEDAEKTMTIGDKNCTISVRAQTFQKLKIYDGKIYDNFVTLTKISDTP